MPTIFTKDLILRTTQLTDVEAFKDFEHRNKEHFSQFTPSYELSDKELMNSYTLGCSTITQATP